MTADDLARLMLERGWTDTSLASLLGVQRWSVHRWRTGRIPISRVVELAISAL